MRDIEITKKEVIFSFAIIFIMVTIGFFISDKITDYVVQNNEVYYKSLKIEENKEQFKYGMKTNVGNAMVYGTLTAVDTVKVPELKGEYLGIGKNTERYTMHTRTVTHTRSDGSKYTTTEKYYTWDEIDYEEVHSKKVSFLDVEFESDKILLPHKIGIFLNKDTVSKKYIDKVYGNYIYEDNYFWESKGDLRYSYSINEIKNKGILFANLKDNTINPVSGKLCNFYANQNIKDFIQDKEYGENTPSNIFWVVWVLIIIGSVIGFVYLDNYWLEDKKESGKT